MHVDPGTPGSSVSLVNDMKEIVGLLRNVRLLPPPSREQVCYAPPKKIDGSCGARGEIAAVASLLRNDMASILLLHAS